MTQNNDNFASTSSTSISTTNKSRKRPYDTANEIDQTVQNITSQHNDTTVSYSTVVPVYKDKVQRKRVEIRNKN